jgi:pimeloyl-ACP methyl ester carboxylesterase
MLSGMAADERLFEPQRARFPSLRVQPWIDPLPGESIRGYAARLARHADSGVPCIIGGASFGGIVALEMAAHLPAVACVLIGSVRSPVELSWKWRVMWPLGLIGPDRLATLARFAARCGRRFVSGGTVRRWQRLARPEAAFVRWAMCALTRWRPRPPNSRVPVFHIHGANDRTLPVELTRPDVVVPTGGHALTLFSPAAVNDFLADVLRRVADPTRALP